MGQQHHWDDRTDPLYFEPRPETPVMDLLDEVPTVIDLPFEASSQDHYEERGYNVIGVPI